MDNIRKRKQFDNDDDALLKIQRVSPYHPDDSDEENQDDTRRSQNTDEEQSNESAEEFSGEEEGEDRQEEGQRMTAFNMKEEMEEGHFDAAGNFIWDKKTNIRDNWVDNINWLQVKEIKKESNDIVDLLDDDDDEEEEIDKNSLNKKYESILTFMKPGESVNQTIRRLAGCTRKLSTMERLKLKKAGKLEEKNDVESITSLANEILLKAGNMDVYEMTYEKIKDKVKVDEKPPVQMQEAVLDMYADDFGVKEKEKLESEASTSNNENKEKPGSSQVDIEEKVEI